MARAIIGVCTLELEIAAAQSLKDKRAILQSLLKRLRNQFNIATAEIDDLDSVEVAVIAFAVVSNSSQHSNSVITHVISWIETHGRDVEVVDQTIEIL
jgi:hypothetical protein